MAKIVRVERCFDYDDDTETYSANCVHIGIQYAKGNMVGALFCAHDEAPEHNVLLYNGAIPPWCTLDDEAVIPDWAKVIDAPRES